MVIYHLGRQIYLGPHTRVVRQGVECYFQKFVIEQILPKLLFLPDVSAANHGLWGQLL